MTGKGKIFTKNVSDVANPNLDLPSVRETNRLISSLPPINCQVWMNAWQEQKQKRILQEPSEGSCKIEMCDTWQVVRPGILTYCVVVMTGPTIVMFYHVPCQVFVVTTPHCVMQMPVPGVQLCDWLVLSRIYLPNICLSHLNLCPDITDHHLNYSHSVAPFLNLFV